VASGKLQENFRRISGEFQVNFRKSSGKFQEGFRKLSGPKKGVKIRKIAAFLYFV